VSLSNHVPLSRSELLAALNSALAQESSCIDCQFDGPIFELRTPDESGSNWSDSLTLRCSGRDVTACVAAARRVAATVRANYNLRHDDDKPQEQHVSRSNNEKTSLTVDRSVYLGFIIDANRINARQADPHMNRLETWRDNEVIELIMSESSHQEARAGGDARRAQKASMHIFSMTMASTASEEQELRSIEKILFPGGAVTLNQRNDVDIVFNAAKYRRILITADGGSKRQPGGMLGNRAALAPLGVRILTAQEAVALVQQKIKERDEMARVSAKMEHRPLPEWVGKD
jgi:hypothetical protein